MNFLRTTQLLWVCETSLEKYLSFELAPYPLALFDQDGMRKTKKSDFYSIFTPSNIQVNINDRHFIDDGFLLHRVVWPTGKKFSEIGTRPSFDMNALKSGWFSEVTDALPGVCLSYEVEAVLHAEKSKFQDIMVLQTKHHGRALILDGLIQSTENDEFSYQEMISFLPLCSHPNPMNVLIVGGGDGGVAREVAKHPSVKVIDQAEIDDRVIEVCKEFLPSMAIGFEDPRVNLFVEDGIKYVERNKNKYDVIITDSSDPVGPNDCLFQERYFQFMKEALRPGGIICSQAGSIWANRSSTVQTYRHCKKVFGNVAYAYTSVPCYPSGQIGFVLGSTNLETEFGQPAYVLPKDTYEEKNIRYYSQSMHSAAFVLPRFYEQLFHE